MENPGFNTKIHTIIIPLSCMEQVRGTRQVFSAHETIEGAGVRLHRAFGYGQVPLFDPFLMLDDFRAGNDPAAYLPGFPWHPHRDFYQGKTGNKTGRRLGL